MRNKKDERLPGDTTGVKPETRTTDAILKFPTLENLTELRSFLGLVNQLGIFIPDLAHATQKLRALLKKNVAYVWLKEHQDAFEKTKELLLENLLIHLFNSGLKTCLLTNASRLKGLGYCLLQFRIEDDSISLIQCGSRSLNAAES